MFNLIHGFTYGIRRTLLLSRSNFNNSLCPKKLSELHTLIRLKSSDSKSIFQNYNENIRKIMSENPKEAEDSNTSSKLKNVRSRGNSRDSTPKSRGNNVLTSADTTNTPSRNESKETCPNGTDKNATPSSTKKKRNRCSKNKSSVEKNPDESMPAYLLSANPDGQTGAAKQEHQLQSSQFDEYATHKGSKSKERKTGGNKNHKQNLGNHNNQKLPEIGFQPYVTLQECSEGLKRGELIQGAIRINARNFNDAFITSDSGGRDIYIEGVAARNRALPGDIVAIKLLPKEEWKRLNVVSNDLTTTKEGDDDSNFSKTGKVVFIIEKKHSRVASGQLNPYRNNAFGFALMSPIDNRLPRLMIPLPECPAEFKLRPKDFEKILFIARISNWNLNMAFASGKLMRSLGEAGHIEPETEAMLIANNIDSSPFCQDVVDCLPNGETWEISSEELSKRKDLRHECIFTVDPATARDLDDALSCKKVGEDRYEVGVHIADVSHFIEQDNALDQVAKQRATSVYLAQRVIPMLPSVLCEQLCSLNPGVERLAYSVIWNLSSDGTVLSEWFGRTIIRSCVKLSYNHAQQMIDRSENDVIKPEEYPQLYGQYNLETIANKVKLLFRISKHLRTRRFDSGALRLDQPKLAFNLDNESGLPNGCQVYEYKDSNKMIEEFMLLANMAVGRKIYSTHPEKAVLRCHPPPHPTMMEDLLSLCKQHNVPFDITDSASISKSLDKVSELDPEIQQYMTSALVLMCTKPFQNAKYFCSGSVDDESLYHHYALNVPIYTHFTSPIRRYPDILVHRLLTAALDEGFNIHGSVKELQAIAEHCNDKKWAAKKASEQSSLLFFAIYLMESGPLSEKGVIVGVLDKAVDVLCTRLGIVTRVYCDKLPLFKHEFKMDKLKPILTLFWQDESKTKDGSMEEKLAALAAQFQRKWAEEKANGLSENGSQMGNVPESLPDDVVQQTLSVFSPVEVILSVNRKTPTKINAVLNSPFATDTPELGL